MTKILASIYLITLGWTGIIIGQEWIRPYVLMSIMILLFSIYKLLQKSEIFYKIFGLRDILLIFFVIYAVLIGIIFPNSKTVNYLLAYSFVFNLTYSFSKYFFSLNIKYKLIHKYNYIGVYIILVYGIFEIIMNNYFNLNLISILWENRTNGAMANLGGHTFIRSYGMMPEPGIFGLYLNSLGIIALFYTNRRHGLLRRSLFNLLFIINYYFISSTASILSIIIAIFLVQFLFLKHKREIINNLIYTLIGSMLLIYFIPDITSILFRKILEPDVHSIQRYENWSLAFELISSLTGFGKGLGYISTIYGSSVNNWYFMLLIETGIVGLSLVLFFLILSLKRGFLFDIKIMKPYLLGILSNMIHFGAISTFFNPFLFLTIAIMDAEIIQRVNLKYK